MRQGQILILVLLLVVVILAVGLAVASRNITNLRTSTQTEQSQRAFTAAEGGVEDVLSNLTVIGEDIASNTGASGCNIAGNVADCDIQVGGLDTDVSIESSSIYRPAISLGNVAQIDLVGYTGDFVRVEWAKVDNQIEVLAEGSASVEIALVYGTFPYNIERWYFQGHDLPVGLTRDETVPAGSNPPGANTTCTPNGYEHCVEIDLRLPIFSNPQILRIKPFFVKTTPRVAGVGADLPLQTYDVESTATTEIGVTRKIQVTRSALPQLPAVFDFALYSETDIVK